MSTSGRNILGSCLTMTVTVGMILSLLVIAGLGVMILTLMAGA
jgi:hypothetical protein